MSTLEESFRRFIEQPAPIISGFVGGTIAAFMFTSVIVWDSLEKSASNTEHISESSSIIHSGAERLYSTVREGDDKFEIGEFERAWNEYEYARDNLRRLQAAYSDRALKYRDAEQVVQNRMYLAKAAAYIDEILPNKAN